MRRAFSHSPHRVGKGTYQPPKALAAAEIPRSWVGGRKFLPPFGFELIGLSQAQAGMRNWIKPSWVAEDQRGILQRHISIAWNKWHEGQLSDAECAGWAIHLRRQMERSTPLASFRTRDID
jgi:hypothetical protein